MAPQVLIDFESIGERIVTAIKSSFDEISKTMVAQTGKQEKLEVHPLDVREQILTNAQVLWPIVHPPARDVYGRLLPTEGTPQMYVIIMGEGTTIRACVVRNNQPVDEGKRQIFLCSNDTTSAEKALEKLLRVTMVMLNKLSKAGIFTQGDQNVVGDDGHYYAPRKAVQGRFTL
ncbi:hypothetical protein LTR56_025201 [Elasticomyces elasticus]|nr:hypothetical protein LTR56_025201 [Elasticomyces elasticus]KAK3649266.1 hypothetical protein LTR22_012995 [Elasticomyces elasticus]KAK4928200.1 hypothetical protein LTR49_005138 [Elasticomyces elasticus]KAK5765954.1 hypothetical protein LTS12_003961 [Elasticomyces elasticus]